MKIGRYLNKRIRSRAGYAAHISLVPGDPDIALVSPGGAPAVLDQPVSLPGLVVHTVADSQHAVVQVLGAAFFVTKNKLLLMDLEYTWIYFNGKLGQYFHRVGGEGIG